MLSIWNVLSAFSRASSAGEKLAVARPAPRTAAALARPGEIVAGLGQHILHQLAHQGTDQFADEARQFQFAMAFQHAFDMLARQRRRR